MNGEEQFQYAPSGLTNFEAPYMVYADTPMEGIEAASPAFYSDESMNGGYLKDGSSSDSKFDED